MNGGSHSMALNQQQQLSTQPQMMMPGVDHQLLQQQQRMWTPNGPADHLGRPFYQAPMPGQPNSNQGGCVHCFTVFWFSFFALITVFEPTF